MRTTYFPKGAGALYSVTAYIITHSYTSGEHPAGHPELKLFFGMTLRKFLMQKLLDGNYEAVRVSAVLIRNGVCNTQVKEQYTCAELGAFHITFYCTKSFFISIRLAIKSEVIIGAPHIVRARNINSPATSFVR
jgi:hypothetical protein